MTLAQYEDEINRLYREDLINADGFASPETWTPASTAEFVRNVVRHFLPSIHSDDQDLLEGGCTRFVRVAPTDEERDADLPFIRPVYTPCGLATRFSAR